MRTLLFALVLALFPQALACGVITEGMWEKTKVYARAHGLDPYLLAAVVWHESRYCKDAIGRKGELGLGQFMPTTFTAVTGKPAGWALDPDWNLWAVAAHLRNLYQTFHDWRKVLMAYNAGAGAVLSGEVPQSSVRYAENVLYIWQHIRGKWK